MDFGLDLAPTGRNNTGGMMNGNGSREKPGTHKNQYSLEMDPAIPAPYLLPPELNNSRESLHSMTRQYAGGDDSYSLAHALPTSPMSTVGPMNNYAHSHSARSNRESSLYTTSPADDAQSTDSYTAELLGHGVKSALTSPPVPAIPSHHILPTSVQTTASPTTHQANEAQAVPQRFGPPSNGNRSLPSNPRPPRDQTPQVVREQQEARHSMDDIPLDDTYGLKEHENYYVTPPSPKDYVVPHTIGADTEHNSRLSYQPDVPYPSYGALEVAPGDGRDMRRVSVGLRPLPPAAEPGDTPEERAMRIRSFYKEYFDDGKDGKRNSAMDYYSQVPPVPSQPTTSYNQEHHDPYDNGGYDDDYRMSFMADDVTPVYDEETGQYVMAGNGPRPYAEPPMRRAMTPPPRGPPRMQNGPRGPPGGHRPFSSQSGRMYGPPAMMGARGRPAPQVLRPIVPLHILPSPHLLTEEAFASPIGFAPGPRARDYQNNTASETGSLRGGVRPYSPTVRAHTPLVSSLEELNALPNP